MATVQVSGAPVSGCSGPRPCHRLRTALGGSGEKQASPVLEGSQQGGYKLVPLRSAANKRRWGPYE